MNLQVVASIDEQGSGPSYSVRRLCESLIAQGVDARLAVLDWRPGVASPWYVERFPVGWGPRRLGRSPAMARWLREEARARKVQLLHSHGLWMMPNVYPGRVRRKYDHVRLVVSPRGTLSAWALRHHRWRKQLMWHLGQGSALKRADAFHATSEAEYDDIRRLGFRQPVAIIPNGIDVPPLAPKPKLERRRLLYLGRIHEQKGLDFLLKAWHAVERRFGDWDLIIAGPDDRGYLRPLRRLAANLRLSRVHFVGPVYGAQKHALYQSADLFVLPTHSENFGMTVAESLAAGTPAIVTRGAPWAGLVQQNAGWWIDIGVDPLVACLEVALAMDREELARLGENGRAWMVEAYSWTAIARQMAVTYRWLLQAGEPPATLRYD